MMGDETPKPDLSDRVTVFVATIGDEPNFTECLARLDAQTVRFRQEIVDHVAPMSAAFQQMIDRCETPYYVQIDEDMLCSPRAIQTLVELIEASPANVGILSAPLWDCDTETPLYGVKIYRHEVVRRFPMRDAFGCDRAQAADLEAAGFKHVRLPLRDRANILGEHGKHYTPPSIFMRWRKLLQKLRRDGNMPWVLPWPRRLLQRYLETGTALHLYAFMGAVAGLVGDLPDDREIDFREGCPDFERLARFFDPRAVEALRGDGGGGER
jgi:hypothetical protein